MKSYKEIIGKWPFYAHFPVSSCKIVPLYRGAYTTDPFKPAFGELDKFNMKLSLL